MINKICPKCGNDFQIENKAFQKTFCSRECANSRAHSEDTKKKIKESANKHWDNLSLSQKRLIINLKKLNVSKGMKTKAEKILFTDWENLSIGLKRIRVIIEQNRKCNRCDNDKWLSEPITFELDHIDGNRHNNQRENLRALCPNCHSLTDNWRGRNNKVSLKQKRILEVSKYI